MSMQRKIHRQIQGSCEKLTFLFACVGMDGNKRHSETIRINNLATVTFHCIQSSHNVMRLQTQFDVYSNGCNVKVKMSSKEYNFHAEKIYTDKTYTEYMGSLLYCLETAAEGQNVLIFQFSVNIQVCKVEVIHEKLYSDNEFTDFRLSTDEGSVAVHKAYLAAHSDVFKAMLNKEWVEAKEGRIQMEEVSLQTLQHLKDYMYLGTLPDDVLPLLSIASCYMIDNLKADCLWRLSQNIKPENFYDMLEYSMASNNPELTFAILKATSGDVVTKAEKICMEKRDKEETKEE